MFLPLRDQNTSGKFPAMNICLLLANTAVFLYQLTLTRHMGQVLIMANAIVPDRIPTWFTGHGSFEGAFLPLLTSMFLHGGLVHFVGNMLFLWVFGDNVEAYFGHLGYLLFYLVCGIGAGLVQVAFNFHSHIPVLGASGAISGVLGAYIVLEPRNQILVLLFVFPVRVPAAVVLGVWFAIQFLSGLSELGTHVNGGVAVWAHIGGFLLGLVAASGVRRT